MAYNYIQRKYREGKVVAYFSKNNSKLRYKLLKIEKKYLTTTLRVKSDYPLGDAYILNKEIDELEKLIDETVTELLANAPKLHITCAIIDQAIAEKREAVKNKIIEEEEKSNNKLLLYDFRVFNSKKLEELKEKDIKRGIIRKQPPTIKDYISACNAIEDFEYDNRCDLKLNDINDDFLEDFLNFLTERHENTEEHTYKCKGNLVNKTINKRLECLSHFVRTFYGDVVKAELIMHARQRTNGREIVRLYKEEIENLYNRELKNSNYNKARDYFVFLCLTGIRFNDLILLDEENFAKGRDGSITLTIYAHKVTIRAQIQLTKVAKEIAERYHYHFRDYTNQAFNRALHELLKNEELFEDEITIFREQLNKLPQPIKVARREKITAHTGRRSFISMLIENGVAPMNVMHMVGHTKLSTLQKYIDKFSPQAKDAIKVLEF